MSRGSLKDVSAFFYFLTQLIKRRSLFQLNFTSGTTSFRENLMVLLSLLKLEPLQEGRWIGIFEREVAALLGVRYVFTFAAGRMALYAILKALDVGKGDEVVIPGYTCVAVPIAIILSGARPVYVDISREDYNMDVNQVEAKITPRTRAIMAQHTFGNPSDLNTLRKLCDKHGLYLIEDCAHTIGTEYEGKKLGAIGDAAFFSTDSTKFISTSIGGIAVTNNQIIGDKLKAIYDNTPFMKKSHILRILLQSIVVNLLSHPRIHYGSQVMYYLYHKSGLHFSMGNEEQVKMPENYPYPARLSHIQAKLGISQLKALRYNLGHRNLIFTKYQKLFEGIKIRNTSPSPLRFVLEVNNRDRWIRVLAPVVKVETWFDSCAHGRHCNLSEIGYNLGDCPVAEKVAKRIINLPTHQKVKPRDVDKIAAWLTEDLRNDIVRETEPND